MQLYKLPDLVPLIGHRVGVSALEAPNHTLYSTGRASRLPPTSEYNSLSGCHYRCGRVDKGGYSKSNLSHA